MVCPREGGILSKIAHSLMSQEFAHDLAGSFCGSTWGCEGRPRMIRQSMTLCLDCFLAYLLWDEKASSYDALVLEGGSLRCAFTAGVLDAFSAINYRPFGHYYGVSAGSMAMISFLSGQRGHFIKLSEKLVEDGKFISFSSVIVRRRAHEFGASCQRGESHVTD